VSSTASHDQVPCIVNMFCKAEFYISTSTIDINVKDN
jgi:hypothetical protein